MNGCTVVLWPWKEFKNVGYLYFEFGKMQLFVLFIVVEVSKELHRQGQ